MPLAQLPGWVVDDVTSVHEEVAPCVDAAPAERLLATGACCRAAIDVLRFHFAPERTLEWVDPLPESTRLALARLHALRR